MAVWCRLIRIALVLLLSGGLVSCAGNTIQSGAAVSTNIILTRHAERTEITKVLTDKGRQRARDLVQAVGDMNVTAIYSPDLERNLDTARPLAEHLGIDITVKPAKSTPHVDAIIDEMLSRHAGGTVLWVGNVDNLRKMYWRLGGDGEGPVVYGDLFIMTVPPEGPVEIRKTTYGM